MMMYIQTSRKPGIKSARTISVIVGGLVIILILIQFLAPSFLPSFFTTIARPFWRMQFSIESGSLRTPAYLLAENEALKFRIQELSAQDTTIDMIRTQNAELLTALGRSDINLTSLNTISTSTPISSLNHVSTSGGSGGARTVAAVLVRPPFAPYDEFIIDIGADHGVVPGAKVYAPGNVLIGTTTVVLSQTTKVSLFSSPGVVYPVLIGSTHIPATAVGRGGGQYEAQVPQATNISKGDIVSDTTLVDGSFGVVTKVITNPADPFETVLFSPPVNIYQVRWVLVDTSSSTKVKK